MILRDPVHGLISFEGPVECIVPELLRARELQRLRRIRALGPASIAFPGAEHSRFAHAVGAAHVMKRYLERVGQLADDLPAGERVDDDQARIALAAALLHDLGHGPFSHTFEAMFPDRPGHEHWTTALVRDPGTEVHAILRERDPAMPEAVVDLLAGRSPIRHLSRAVSGTFDVDRCDYLLRDSHMTGVRYGLLDLEWLLRSLRLHVPAGERGARLAVDGEKGLVAVEGFFLARLYMYRQVYLHKAVRSAEIMLCSLFARLRELEDRPELPSGLAALVSGRTPTLGEYLALDDHALLVVLPRLAEHADPVVARLGRGLVDRRLLKTLRLSPQAPFDRVEAELARAVRDSGIDPHHLIGVDRREIEAYPEDDVLQVLDGGKALRLIDASPILHGLARARITLDRAVFPAEARAAVQAALAPWT